MRSLSFVFICSLFLQGLCAAEDLQVNAIFSSHMVLQRDVETRVWGTAIAGAEVQVQFAEQQHSATADAQGRWQVALDALPAGGPYQMKIQSGEASLALDDILMGDVWLCSGQSNMGWTVSASNNPEEEIAAAQYPQIRLFSVRLTTKQEPQASVIGSWSVCSPTSVPRFSAVGYYFGRHLHKELNVPIGLINSSWGGTPAEAWTSRASLEKHEQLSPITDRFAKAMENYDVKAKDYLEEKKRYEAAQKKIKENPADAPERHANPENTGLAKGYAAADFDDASWEAVKVPHAWSNLEDGVKWYRKSVAIPEALQGQAATVHLGPIDDMDVTYVNGKEIGKTGVETPQFWSHKRAYALEALPAELCIAVRVFDHFGGGSLGKNAAGMFIAVGDQRIPLAGQWKMKTEHALNPFALRETVRPRAPMGPDHSHAPAGLYNAMIYPLMPLAIKGAIWYQGETNGSRGYQYQTLLPTMISDWRAGFQSGDFPFLIVQLANFRQPQSTPAADNWAELRNAQLLTALNDPNSGLAVTIDIGEANDIHPRNKQDVGKRLGLAAQKIAYDQDVVYSGPIFKEAVIENDQIRITFDHVGSGLVAKDGGPLQRFSIAGEDQVFHWAEAEIQGASVVVKSKDVPNPKAVRYAWEINPAGCNLYNQEGLPASPFRTDDWTLSSFERY